MHIKIQIVHVGLRGCSIRSDVDFYVIDRKTGIRHPLMRWPQEALDLIYSDLDAFKAQSVVVEDVDWERGPVGIYGTWMYRVQETYSFIKRHPRLRRFLGLEPYISLELNAAGEELAWKEEQDDMTAAHSAPC